MRIIGILVLICASAVGQVTLSGNVTVSGSATVGATSGPVFFGIPVNAGTTPNWTGSTIYRPTNYGTLADLSVGYANRINDPEFGTPIWKVADMATHSTNEPFDTLDRYIMSTTMLVGPTQGGSWYGANGLRVRNITTGAMACDMELSGLSANAWGRGTTVRTNGSNSWTDNDVMFVFVRTTGQIVRVNIPVCEAATAANPSFQLTSATQSSPQGNVSDVWDTIYPTTSRNDSAGNPVGYTGTMTCSAGACTWVSGTKFVTASAGQTIMIGSPAVSHTVASVTNSTTISITPADTYGTATAYYVAWESAGFCRAAADVSVDGDHLCIDNETGGNAIGPRRYTISTKTFDPEIQQDGSQPGTTWFRSAWFAPGKSDQFVVPYALSPSGTRLSLYNAVTGAKIRTVVDSAWGHATTLAESGTGGYAITDQSSNIPAGCTGPAYVAFPIDNPAASFCIVGSLPGEPYLTGFQGDTGHEYVVASTVDMGLGSGTVYGWNPFTTVAGLASVTGNTWWVTDALNPGDCSTGGGTNWAFCSRDPLISTQWNNTSTASYPISATALSSDTTWSQYFSGAWKTDYFNNEIILIPVDGSAPRHMIHHRSLITEYWDQYHNNGARGTMSCTGTTCTWVSGDAFVTGTSWNGMTLISQGYNGNNTVNVSSVSSSTSMTMATAPTTNGTYQFIFKNIVPFYTAVHVKCSWSGKLCAFDSDWAQHNTVNLYVFQVYQ